MSGPAPQPSRRRRLSDDEVAALPLSAGRAELLEEIMSTPVRDHAGSSPAAPPSHPRRTRWLAPLAAAAVVAGLATVPLWAGGDGPGGGAAADPTSSTAPVEAGSFVVLDAPGWQVDYLDAGESGQDEVSYVKGDLGLEINSRPESLYAEYVEDREHIVDPPGPGEPVRALGLDGQLWSYSARDHTVILEPDAGTSLEIRGSGLRKADYLALLGDLRRVDQDAFEASLPSRFVPGPARAQEILDGITAAIDLDGLTVPPGEELPTFEAQPSDPYQLGAEISGAVTCRWLASYDAAQQSGDTGAADRAARAMSTSRQWPILQEMDAEGDYPEVVWEYADDMAAGRSVAGYPGALGCE